MQTARLRGLPSRSARVTAALTRMTAGAVFEIPAANIRERYMSAIKVICWTRPSGGFEILTWDESKTKSTPPRWSIDGDGRLLDNGAATAWFVYDLRPTGENAYDDILAALPEDDEDEDAPTSTHGVIIPFVRVGEQAL